MHPVLFSLFGYPFYIYSLMITLGCVAGIWLCVRYARQVGISQILMLDLCWWLILGGYLGSRVVFMVVNWRDHWYPCVDYQYYNTISGRPPLESADCWPLIAFWSGGLVFYGAFLGGIVVLWWFTRRHKLSLLKIADAIFPAFAIGQFFGRLGCLAAGCCWGKPTDFIWGLEFPRGSMVYAQHLKRDWIESGAAHAIPIHPTQLYDSLYGLGLFIVLTWIRRNKRYHGQVFLWWLVLYPLLRSTVEMFRGDTDRGYVFRVVYEPLNYWLGIPKGSITFLSTSQFISLSVMFASLIGILMIRANMRKAH